jgi:hypothetical protein
MHSRFRHESDKIPFTLLTFLPIIPGINGEVEVGLLLTIETFEFVKWHQGVLKSGRARKMNCQGRWYLGPTEDTPMFMAYGTTPLAKMRKAG